MAGCPMLTDYRPLSTSCFQHHGSCHHAGPGDYLLTLGSLSWNIIDDDLPIAKSRREQA